MRRLLLLCGLLFFLSALQAQQWRVTKAQAPQTVSFAQPFTAQYLLEHEPGYQVTPDPEAFPADFEITHTQAQTVAPNQTAYEITAVPFTLGKSTFTISFQLRQGDKVTAHQEHPLEIEVSPVSTFPDNKFREIRPPFIPKDWFIWLLIFLVLLAILGTFYRWRSHARKLRSLAVDLTQDTRPSHVIALSQIEALLQSSLWEKGQYQTFYVSLTDVLREYLRRRFGLDVSADTSSELLAHLKTKQELAVFMADLRRFLTESDLVKFAKVVPTEQQRNNHISMLRTLVEKTIPAPSAPEVRP